MVSDTLVLKKKNLCLFLNIDEEEWGISVCVLFWYSSILGRGFYRSAHDPPFEKGSFSVLMLENNIKTQIFLRESILREEC